MSAGGDATLRKVMAGIFGLAIIGAGYLGPYSWISAAADGRRAATAQARENADALARRSRESAARGQRRVTVVGELRQDGLFQPQSAGIAKFVGGMGDLARRSGASLGSVTFTRAGQPAPAATPSPSPTPAASAMQKAAGALDAGDDTPAIRRGAVAARTDFDGVAASVHVIGTASAIRGVLEGMAALPVTAGITSVSIVPTTGFSKGHVVLDATLTLTIYFLNPSQFGVGA